MAGITKNDLKIELTGVLSWALLCFGVLKLCLVYPPETFNAYLLCHLVVSCAFCIIYLLFFFGYYRLRYSFLIHLKLVLAFNAMLFLYDLLYDNVILVHAPSWHHSIVLFGIVLIVNLVISVVLYLLIKKFSKDE